MCIFSIPIFALEINTSDNPMTEVEAYTKPISELIPIGEDVLQPSSISLQITDAMLASTNSTDNDEPGSWVSTETIYTTDGTMVEAYHFYDYPSDEARQALQDRIVNGAEDSDGRAYTELVGDNVKELPTWRYNCHAFAWYNDTVWINYAEPFVDDLHTGDSISVEDVQNGDIVTYWAVSHLNGEISSYDLCLHSAIVEDIESDGTIICKSKWGAWGLYVHDINYVPTSYCNLVFEEETGSIEGYKVVCLFYRYTQDEHDCSIAKYPLYHERICNSCSYTMFEAHTWSYEQHSINVHKTSCSECSYWEYQEHTWLYNGTKYICRQCQEDTLFIPTDVMSLSEEGLELLLSSMSEEELAEFVASLPEDALARVTAILPPVDDDEFLTE